jgi:hypothetical protein
MLALDDDGFSRELARRSGGLLGEVRVIGQRWSYPLTAMAAERYTAERMALVGDAAHGIHPIAGQGLNLGFRDVAALADLVIAAVAAGEDPGGPALLARSQAARRPAAMMMLGATHALEKLFGNGFPPLRAARRLGIAAVNAYCSKTYSHPFDALDAPTRDTVLAALETGKIDLADVPATVFFGQLLQNTREGYFCDPVHGGNRDMGGWKMIGFPGARADFMDFVNQDGQAYPYGPVSIEGKRT